MSTKYEGLAKIIVQNVGGRTNIKGLTAENDRLYFELEDFGRANTDILKGTEGVADVDNSGQRYEVAIRKNPGEVYAAVCERAGLSVEGYVVSEGGGGSILFSKLLIFVAAFAVSIGVIVAVNAAVLGGALGLPIEVAFAAAAAAIGVIVGSLMNRSGRAENETPPAIFGEQQPLLSPKGEKLGAPVEGVAAELSGIDDEAFASGALGKGLWFEPLVGKLYAPCDGELTTFFSSGHAVGLHSDNGADVLIHVGLNTVALKGEGFHSKRKQGDYVKRGELLLEFDIEAIKAAGYSLATPMVITNTESYGEVKSIKTGSVKPGENVLSVR